MRVGDLEVSPLQDGEFIAGPEYFGADASFETHQALLAGDGKMHLPIACFLIRGGPLQRAVLVDAGLGTLSGDTFTGGRLLNELAATGTTPADIDLVVCSHLHVDHCGWLFDQGGAPVFGNAQIAVSQADWEYFVVSRQGLILDHVREGLLEHHDAGRIDLLDGDRTVAPAITALQAPGHTPGHLVLVLADEGERALLLGDAISCPAQLEETTWGAISDVDPKLAQRTRERLWREMEATETPAAGAHFPDLQFGRVLRAGAGRRWVSGPPSRARA